MSNRGRNVRLDDDDYGDYGDDDDGDDYDYGAGAGAGAGAAGAGGDDGFPDAELLNATYDAVEAVVGAGFGEAAIVAALRASDYDPDRAIGRLLDPPAPAAAKKGAKAGGGGGGGGGGEREAHRPPPD